MRHLVFAFVAFVLAVAGCVHSQPGDAPDFAALEQRWMDALSEKKLAELEELLASDFTIVGAGSSADDPIGDRAGWLANARRFPWPRHQVRVLQTRRLGETAIVHAILVADYPPKSITPEGGRVTFVVTDVWVWRDGRWQVANRHASLSR